MPRLCHAPGCCLHASSRYSLFCSGHKARLRRHGAVDQETISKTALKPFLKLVRARIDKNRGNPLWGQLDQRWGALTEHAKGIIAYRGAMARHERQAAHEVIKLADHVQGREVVETTLAMFLMQEFEPRRFRGDRAFRTQLVRRVRGLSDVNAGTWFNHRTGKSTRAYRELTPRTANVLGQWLAVAFGGTGIHLARLEQVERDRKRQQTNAFQTMLKEIV